MAKFTLAMQSFTLVFLVGTFIYQAKINNLNAKTIKDLLRRIRALENPPEANYGDSWEEYQKQKEAWAEYQRVNEQGKNLG